MSRRTNFLAIIAISGIFLLFLYANNSFNPSNTTKTVYYGNHESTNRLKFNYIKNRLKYVNDGLWNNVVPLPYNMTEFDEILKQQRDRIADEMQNFEFPGGRFYVDAEKLSDLTMETQGIPYRSVIITTWRSGSTFLGDILNAMPANFYHYEPLLNYNIVQVRGPPHDNYHTRAIRNLKQLLSCNFTDMDEYFEYGKTHNWLFLHNHRLWSVCKAYPQYCFEPKFVTKFCKLFPLQSMKVVRLRAALAEQLLEDESLNVRMLLLVRDPRAVLQSRKHRDWCPGQPDCDDPQHLCGDMVSDYNAAVELVKKYPLKFRVLRYEDLSLNVYDQTQEILQFYGLPFDQMVEEFLDSHTTENKGDVSSTYRDSKTAPLHWMKELPYEEIQYIQDECTEAMQLWGYKKIAHEDELNTTFKVLLPSKFS